MNINQIILRLEYSEHRVLARHLRSEEPTIAVNDLTGAIAAWIEIGAPYAARLHKASKAAKRAVVYTHEDPEPLVRRLRGEKDPSGSRRGTVRSRPVAALAARLERRLAFSVSIAEREIYLSIGNETLTGTVRRLRLDS